MNRKNNLPFRYTGYVYITKEGKINLLDAIPGERLVRSSLFENVPSGYFQGSIGLNALSIAENASASYLFSKATYRE